MSTAIPYIRYKDAAAAIEWLCNVLGFEKQMVIRGEGTKVLHAQLTLGKGMIMVGATCNENEYSKLLAQPTDLQGRETQTPYLVFSDADAVYRRVQEAGNEVVIEIIDESWGGRDFTCRDIEGHIWNIGTHDPWVARCPHELNMTQCSEHDRNDH